MINRVTDEAVWDILAAPLTVPAKELAERWGVSVQTVRLYKRLRAKKAKNIVRLMDTHGATYHLLPPPSSTNRGVLTPEQVREIRDSAVNSNTLAKKYGCSSSLIRMVKLRRVYKDVED